MSKGRQDPATGALALLTVLPLPKAQMPADPARLPGWFPLVGLVVFGSIAEAILLLGWAMASLLGRSYEMGAGRLSLLFAVAVVFAWAVLSRFMHWDGLADTADGFWGGATLESRLEIMRDSSTGAFGATAIVFLVAIQCAALAAVVEVGTPLLIPLLLAVPTLGRLAATFASWFGKPARSDGLGAGHDSRPAAASVALVLFALAVVGGLPLLLGYVDLVVWAIVILVGVASAAMVPHLLSGRFGGVTGDLMGASIIITEAITLVAAALVAGI